MSARDEDELLAGLRLDDRAGPARRGSREQSLTMVEQALETWDRERPARERRSAIFKSVAAAAAILVAVAGGASAARWYYGPTLPTVELTAPKARILTAPPDRRRAAPETVSSEAAPPEQELEAEPATVPAPRPHRSAAVDKAEPDDLLQRANRLRAEGRFEAAADTYALVYDRYPRSLSAYAARVAAGSILLEHLAKPHLARKLFEGALRSQPRGALDLEARQGLALSLRDMGRDREEREALRALISNHGESPAARRAVARLAELSEGK